MKVIVPTDSDDHIGLAVARSLGKKNIPFSIVSKNTGTLARYSRYCRESHISSFDLDFFSKLTKQDLVYPMIENSMLLLSKNRQKLSCNLAFSEFAVLEKVINKTSLISHAIDHNIPCPKTFFVNTRQDLKSLNPDTDYPIILKPNRGAGGTGIMTIESPTDLKKNAESVFRQYGPFMLQEKIPFRYKWTVGALCNADFQLRRICILKELRNFPVETGQACFVETRYHKDLLDITRRLLESLQYFGVANIDFLIDERTKKPVLMEINPRFWGCCQAAINAGVDFPSLLYEMVVNGDIDRSLEFRTGHRCRYVVFNDLQRLICILQGPYATAIKMNAIKGFFKFYEDNSYYIFSQDDLMPLLALMSIKCKRLFRSVNNK